MRTDTIQGVFIYHSLGRVEYPLDFKFLSKLLPANRPTHARHLHSVQRVLIVDAETWFLLTGRFVCAAVFITRTYSWAHYNNIRYYLRAAPTGRYNIASFEITSSFILLNIIIITSIYFIFQGRRPPICVVVVCKRWRAGERRTRVLKRNKRRRTTCCCNLYSILYSLPSNTVPWFSDTRETSESIYNACTCARALRRPVKKWASVQTDSTLFSRWRYTVYCTLCR